MFKKLHFLKLVVRYKDNTKKAWSVIEGAIGEKNTTTKFPQKNLYRK